MAELKNALSGTFYLAAALAYLRFDRERNPSAYGAAVALFVLALLSKSVTATLPAGLLVVFWWQRERLTWRRDVAPLLPFFILGTLSSVLTAWVERTIIGAGNTTLSLNFIERTLVAGRAIAFYLVKLIWPANLIFIYPRWHIDAANVWQYLYPIGVLAALAALWAIRARSRAPLAALLYFGVTVSPALGFVDVFSFKYSFVADHFQYLACIGIIVFAAAAIKTLTQRFTLVPSRAVDAALILIAGVPLAWLTNAQSRQYTDAKTQYLITLQRNPESWLAHTNLALIELQGTPAGQEEAIRHFEAAFRIEPNDPLVQNNFGWALRQMNRLNEAVIHHEKAIELASNYAEAYQNLGADLMLQDRLTRISHTQ